MSSGPGVTKGKRLKENCKKIIIIKQITKTLKKIIAAALPCAGKEKGQPSTCSSHNDHLLGNSIGDQKNTYLSVHHK